jgi:protocatechuate 3,4-dioxygenase beta subunit
VLVRALDPRGQPAAGVAISHREPELAPGQRPRETSNPDDVTDARGELRIEPLAAGVHGFRISAPRAWGPSERQPPPWQEAIVREGEQALVVLAAPARGGLHGTVRESGTLLAGAQLRLVAADGDGARNAYWGNERLTARADRNGAYRFDGVESAAYWLYVDHAERRMAAVYDVQITDELQRLDVELPVASIEGRVVDEDGRPVEGLAVDVAPARHDRPSFGVGRAQLVEDENGALQWRESKPREGRERTDHDGRYELRGVRTNEALRVTIRGDTIVPATSDEIVVAPDQVRRGVDFRVEPAAAIDVRLQATTRRGEWLHVKLELAGAEGKPPAQTRETWIGIGESERVGGLKAGTWRIRATDGAHTLAEASVEIARGEVRAAVLQLP